MRIKPQLECLEDRLAPSASPFAPLNLYAGSLSNSSGTGGQVSGVLAEVPSNLFPSLPNSNSPGTVDLIGVGTNPSGGSEVLFITLSGSTGTWIGENPNGMQSGVALLNPGPAGPPGFLNLPNLTDLVLMGNASNGVTSIANLLVYPIGNTTTPPSNPPPPAPNPNAPMITDLNPSVGNPSQTVVITGINLNGATSVTFGGNSASIEADTPTLIEVMTPMHAAGTVDVSVTTPDGTATDPGGFFYT
jgi:IPT/TIG domain